MVMRPRMLMGPNPKAVSRYAYPALAFMTGAAVMVYEFAAPNLFRAWFGQTIHVWANVIGVILAALAAGYALGGRWADSSKSLRPLATVIGFAGLYGLVVAWFGPAFCAWLAGPAEYTQDGAQQAYFAQSLAASLGSRSSPEAAWLPRLIIQA